MSSTAALQRMRILVVDDDLTCRALLDAIFEIHGFEVCTSDSVFGVCGLLDSFRLDVILLDLALPYRSGANLLGELKSRPETAVIPVVILSAAPELLSGSRRDLAAAVVSKPFGNRHLVEIVQSVCAYQAAPDTAASLGLASSQHLGSL